MKRLRSYARDVVWIGLALSLSAAQIIATIADRNVWPISAYNVFNFEVGARFTDFEIALTDTEGQRFLVPPGRIMPLDFFRANAVVRDQFVARTDPATQFRIADLVLRTLNERPWGAWDEILEAASSLTPHEFRTFEVIVVEHDTSTMAVIRRTPIFNYTAVR